MIKVVTHKNEILEFDTLSAALDDNIVFACATMLDTTTGTTYVYDKDFNLVLEEQIVTSGIYFTKAELELLNNSIGYTQYNSDGVTSLMLEALKEKINGGVMLR